MVRRHCRNLHIATLAWLLTSCSAGEVVLYEPEGSGLARGLTVKVELDSAAADIAEVLGWTDGVPEAEVRVHHVGTTFRWDTALTDSAGIARFPHLIQGMHRVAAYRVLTDDEAVHLGDRRRAFGDGKYVGVTERTVHTLRLAADVPGSVVFSEVCATAPYVDEVDYDFNNFLELHNNSDAPVFLDGMIVGRVAPPNMDSDLYFSCTDTEPFRNDPTSIWAIYFHQFPGSGADYPLLPGMTALIAQDAIDHSVLDPRFPDLSDADFEFLGPGDVDNPAVPNMPEVGLHAYYGGHGMRFFVGHVFFISKPVDIEGLERRTMQHSGGGWEVVRFPREAILDVIVTAANDPLRDQQYPPCGMDTHRSFDRLGGGFIEHGEDLEYSVQRLVIETVNGRKTLQDTNTSAVDLVRAPYTPGTLPDGPGF
jgi:hypothetical protein